MTAQTGGDASHTSAPHAETATAHAAMPRREEAAAEPAAEQPAGEQPDASPPGAATAAPGDAEEAAPAVGPAPETPEQERARLLAAVKEAEDRCLRARAELDNAQKRHRRDLDLQRSYAASETLREVLPVLDNLDMSLRAASQGADDPQALLAGIRMIREQLEQVVLRQGAVRIQAKGEPFDPAIHEAISVIPSDDVEREMVIEEARGGYELKGRVLRAAQVIVAKPAARPAADDAGDAGDAGDAETASENAAVGENERAMTPTVGEKKSEQ